MAQEAVWLSGVAPSYEATEAILQRMGHANISAASIWRRVQVWGEQFKALAEAESAQANALTAQWEPPSRAEVANQRMGVAMNGAMIYSLQRGLERVEGGHGVRDCGLADQGQTNEGVGRVGPRRTQQLCGPLGRAGSLGEMVWAEARRRGWEQAQDSEVLGDGPYGSGTKPRCTSRTATKSWTGITANNI